MCESRCRATIEGSCDAGAASPIAARSGLQIAASAASAAGASTARQAVLTSSSSRCGSAIVCREFGVLKSVREVQGLIDGLGASTLHRLPCLAGLSALEGSKQKLVGLRG